MQDGDRKPWARWITVSSIQGEIGVGIAPPPLVEATQIAKGGRGVVPQQRPWSEQAMQPTAQGLVQQWESGLVAGQRSAMYHR